MEEVKSQELELKQKIDEPPKRKKTVINKTPEIKNVNLNLNLKDEYIKACSGDNEEKCNDFILKKEFVEHTEFLENPETNSELYPNLNDPNFILKIAEKKEFNDTKYDGEIRDIKEYADILSKADFEISPHQAFVRNFMSFQTPYNALLLYHGLGTGKTFSSIGVCEEMRSYLKQIGMSKRIMIVASPNVQDNFRLQLFDERKLKEENGIWTIKNPISSKLLKEVNPMNMKGIPKEKIVSQINTLITHSYLFLGYIEFANYIEKVCLGHSGKRDDRSQKREKCEISGKDGNQRKIQNLKQEFSNRLIVIDEVHNIRISSDSENKIVAEQLYNLVKYADNLRLLLLSATPMYNNYMEIVWLLNLMNMNDRRATMDVRDVFESNGDFVKNEKGEEVGKELLIRKATGYVSYVRGNNPYTFPYAVYPILFSPDNTFPKIPYPNFQMNGKPIEEKDKIKILSLYLTEIGEYQSLGYQYLMDQLQRKSNVITTKKGVVRNMPTFENIESFGYALLQLPIEALNIVYPLEGLEDLLGKDVNASISISNKETISGELDESAADRNRLYVSSNEITGTRGLQRIMNYVDLKNPLEKGSFEYRDEEKYGRIFSPSEIGKYSSKIKHICEEVMKSTGIVLIYSQYIDGGLIPMALALEELGFLRFGKSAKSLFKESPAEPLDVKTMKKREKTVGASKDFQPARYSMITGDVRLSPDNDYEVKALTNENNVNGEKVKVVLISRAGSEGIDLKCIRQVHIMDPWYNMNRIEQTVGRAIRNFSHKELPFEERNAEIFLYGTMLKNKEEESADLYVYRIAEVKAIQIGKVTRVLKETAVDCLLNHDQTNFTQEEIAKSLNKTYKQVLSDGKVIEEFKIGDRPYSAEMDYMKDGNYKCYPDKEIGELNEDTYNESFIHNNGDKIMKKIRDLFKEHFFYKKKDLIQKINVPKVYPLVQIYAALTQMIEDTSETIVDKYGRIGYLVNIGEYYLFQPSELNNKQISLFERSVPIDFKNNVVRVDLTGSTSTPKKVKTQKGELKSDLKGDSKDDLVESEKVKPVNQDNMKSRESNKQSENDKEGPALIERMRENYETAINSFQAGEKVPRGDENWYKHCGIAMKRLAVEQNVPESSLKDYLTKHIVDMLAVDEKIAVLQYIDSKPWADDSFERKFQKIFEDMYIRLTNLTGILFYNGNQEKIMILNEKTKQWSPAESEDVFDIHSELEKRKKTQNDRKPNSTILGFISYDQKNKYLVFKTKNTTLKRNVGARCDESGKIKRLQILNEILGYEKYDKETSKGMVQFELCALQEFLLRYYQNIEKDGKTWFLDFEQAMSYGL